MRPRPHLWPAVMIAVAAVILCGCGDDDPLVVPDPGADAIAGATPPPTPAPEGRYDHSTFPTDPPLPRLPHQPNVAAPLLPGDPGEDAAREVIARHEAQIRAIPGWTGHGISRHDGRTVIVVMSQRPVPEADRIAELDGIPLFYMVAGPFRAF